MKALLLALCFLPAFSGAFPVPPAGPASGVVSPAAAFESESPSEIFTLVEKALRSSDMSSISKLFGRQVYVSLKGGESGYFSANQASFILQSFFGSRRPVNFSFSTIQQDGEPFATGSGIFLTKGSRETLQVYVAAARQGNRWVVSQFNVY